MNAINYNNIKDIITNYNINITALPNKDDIYLYFNGQFCKINNRNNFEDFLMLNLRNNINNIDLNTYNNNSFPFIYPNKEEK